MWIKLQIIERKVKKKWKFIIFKYKYKKQRWIRWIK